MKKLVLITPFYYPSMGGVQECFRLFAEYFVSQGWKVQVHTSQLQDIDDIRVKELKRIHNFLSYQVKDGIEIFRYEGGGLLESVLGLAYAVSYKIKLPVADKFFLKYRLRGLRSRMMLKKIDEFKPDVIIAGPCVDFMMSLALAAKERTGAKLIIHNALHLSDDRQMGLSSAVQKLKKVDMVQANTEYEKDYLIKEGLDPKKIYVSGPAVDVSHFSEEADETRADGRVRNKLEGKQYVLYLGRKDEGKGVLTLIQAINEVRKDHPQLNLALAGPETIFSRKVLDPLIANKYYMHSFGRVDFHTKRWLLQNAALFVMVSHVDSFGIVYCESWLSRRPVVAADFSQMRCVVREGETGFLAPYGDSKKLAEVLTKALSDPKNLDRLGENGYKHVQSTFADQAIEKRMFRAAEELVSSPSKS